MAPFRVVLLPGGFLPVTLAYGALLETLGKEVDAVAKDLELYAGPEPPPDYSLDHEIAGVLREADAPGPALERFTAPLYYALGGLSNPVEYEESAERLRQTFPDFELDVFEERHHFDPPHRVEPERLATSLRALWRRAEQASA